MESELRKMDMNEKFFVTERIYTILVLFFLVCFNKLENQLRAMKFKNLLDLLMYDHCKFMWCLLLAFILFIFGCDILYNIFNCVRRDNLFYAILTSTILGIVSLYIRILNPIFRTILIVAAPEGGIKKLFISYLWYSMYAGIFFMIWESAEIERK